MRAPACRCCRWSPALRETRRQILLYTLLLAPLGVAPWLLGYAGLSYRHRCARDRRDHDRAGAARRAEEDRAHAHAASKQMFGFSILYLFLLFAMLLVDHASAGLLSHGAA